MWRFNPIYKTTIWGGSAIGPFKGAAGAGVPCGHVGESWEVSGLDGDLSEVADGPDSGSTLPELIHKYGAGLMGAECLRRYGCRFPLLVKLLDAAADLSVQVHPDDAMAGRLGLPNGKNEMWYVLRTRPGARLCAGFSRSVSRADYPELVANGDITAHLNFTEVHPHEAYFIPAGTVHALCSGCLVLEIQQSSDVTYRIFDYNRRDKDGRLRQLHTELAMDALHFDGVGSHRIEYDAEPEEGVAPLLTTPQFDVNRIAVERPLTRCYGALDSFKLLCVAEGEVRITSSCGAMDAGQGTVVLAAADERNLRLTPLSGSAVIIETYINPHSK